MRNSFRGSELLQIAAKLLHWKGVFSIEMGRFRIQILAPGQGFES
jgi:hypothetical protein